MNKTQLEDAYKVLEADNEKLKAELEAAKSSDANAELEAAEKIVEDLSVKNEDLEAEITKLKELVKTARPEKEEKKIVALPEPFEVDGKIIKIKTHAFNYAGGRVTAAELKEKPELIKKLLEMESNILEVVSE